MIHGREIVNNMLSRRTAKCVFVGSGEALHD